MADITAETIRQFIASVAPDIDLTALGDDTPFDDIELDSIDFFNLLLEVQTYCEIEIPDNDLDQCNSVEKIITYCASK